MSQMRFIMLFGLGFIFTVSLSQAEEPKPTKVENAENITVFSQGGIYSVFPFLPKDQPKDEIILSFAPRTVPSHNDPTGGIDIMRSTDGCRTWQILEKREQDFTSEESKEIQAVKGPDGTLISVHAGWEYYPEDKRAELTAAGCEMGEGGQGRIAALTAHHVMLSHDAGKSWMEQELPLPNPWGVMCFHGGIMTDQGICLWPVYGLSMPGDSGHSYVYRSADSGKTWTFHEIIADSRGQMPMNETALIDLGGGHILAFARTGGNIDHMYRAESINGGITWGRLADSGIQGHPADLLKLQNGDILLTYGFRHAPFGVRARISKDDGKTFGDEYILRDDGLNSDLGYPMSIQLPDGIIFTTYYFRVAGGPTHIAGTLWREP